MGPRIEVRDSPGLETQSLSYPDRDQKQLFSPQTFCPLAITWNADVVVAIGTRKSLPVGTLLLPLGWSQRAMSTFRSAGFDSKATPISLAVILSSIFSVGNAGIVIDRYGDSLVV